MYPVSEGPHRVTHAGVCVKGGLCSLPVLSFHTVSATPNPSTTPEPPAARRNPFPCESPSNVPLTASLLI